MQLDVLQPDIYWAGGLSEVLKIAAYASVHDLVVIQHGHSTPAGLHFSLAQSPLLTPIQECLGNGTRPTNTSSPIRSHRSVENLGGRHCRASAWISILPRSRCRRRFTTDRV